MVGSSGAFGGPGTSSLTLSSTTEIGVNSCSFGQSTQVMDPVTAVAFTGDGRLLAQTREPARLLVLRELPSGSPTTIELGGDSRADTGHDLFHRDSGGGIACASCHPEGGEDGQTWRFADTGARRTQALHIGLRDTAPFHWGGDLANVGELMTEVFVQRMGGVRQSSPRLQRLTEFLFSLPPPPPIRDASDATVARGQALFDSADVGCATCHSGAKLTNNQSVAIDSVLAQKLQVPSLVAIGYRAPFMHTGCAATLADRFNPACGGNAHGNTSGLNAEQLGDLVAYLESL
jgi:mono/diheme cytochrome c family protein